jgi:hypothetical protein
VFLEAPTQKSTKMKVNCDICDTCLQEEQKIVTLYNKNRKIIGKICIDCFYKKNPKIKPEPTFGQYTRVLDI